MKVRIKYAKMGNLKFIGHLDIMRFFQKAVKRAGLDVAYTKGFSPHQIMTFAAPLALGVTSEGEYFDAEFHTVVSSKEFVRRFNEQMVEGMEVKDVVLLPDEAKKAMAIVAASDYRITILKEAVREPVLNVVSHLLEKECIEVLRKTKKNEKIEDIRSGILELSQDGEGIYMFLSTGSEYNLKPETVLEAACNEAGVPYVRFDYQVHRLETYMKNEDGSLVSLLESGTRME